MKRNFGATQNRKEAVSLSFRGVSWNAVSPCDGPGSSAARRPSTNKAPGRGGSVRYQQNGLRAAAVRPFRGTTRRGNPGGFLVQHQGEAMNLRPSLVAGPEGS